MEIADYLKVARRSLWVLLVVPLGAALLAGLVTVKSPPTYQATATVDIPLGDGKSPYAGSHGQVLYVDDFRNAVTSDPVITAVSKQTGVPEKKLSGNLLVKQVGNSSVMTISFTAADKTVPPAVVDATAKATLQRILDTQYDASQPALQAALDARQPLLDRQAELSKQTGGVSPDNAIRALHNEINSLRRQQHNLQARGVSASTLDAVNAQLKDAQARLVQYQPISIEYQQLKTELTSANQAVTKQSQVVQAVKVLQTAAQSPSAVIVTGAKKKPRLPTVISASVAAAGAGAFLALGIIAVMELRARRRRQHAELLAPEPDDAPDDSDRPEDETGPDDQNDPEDDTAPDVEPRPDDDTTPDDLTPDVEPDGRDVSPASAAGSGRSKRRRRRAARAAAQAAALAAVPAAGPEPSDDGAAQSPTSIRLPLTQK